MHFEKSCHVLVYGATSAGIAASIQCKRMGKSVVLIGTTERIGGLTTGGLGQTDIGCKEIIGGISREFYQEIRQHYEDPAAWRWQSAKEYRDGGQTKTLDGEDARWTFEPSAALAVFEQMLEKEGISLILNQQLDRESGVTVVDGKIHEIRMVTGESYQAEVFIDTTYEGDLMAAAGVSYAVGREPNSAFGETLNGVQKSDHGVTLQGRPSPNAVGHQLQPGVDPYIKAGDPLSGVLPGIDPDHSGEDGSGDNRIQAYCFRLCLTDHPENRIPFSRPDRYDPLQYELLLRNLEQGESMIPLIHSSMPNRKTDSNNRRGFSTDYIGYNYNYPEASDEERAKIVEEHLNYTEGLMWTLASNPRVPEEMREFFNQWGLCRDEFERNRGWPASLYIREARRLRGEYVMTQKNCEKLVTVEDSIGMAAYTMDSHHVCRYIDDNGFVRNEGNVEARINEPYPVSYRSIVPRQEEVENLLVPVCLSATHIAFGSIRMEPIFMVLAQSAAVAAVLALEMKLPVQQIPYQILEEKLIEVGQVLHEPKLIPAE